MEDGRLRLLTDGKGLHGDSHAPVPSGPRAAIRSRMAFSSAGSNGAAFGA